MLHPPPISPGQIDTSPLCPPVTASMHHKLAWLIGSRSRAEGELRASDPYQGIQQAIDIIANRVMEKIEATTGKRKSRASLNRIKRQMQELVSLLTQRIKPRWEYYSCNPQWQDTALIFTKRLKAWFDTNMFDRSLKAALQWAMTGTGYLLAGWSRAYPGFMESDLEIEVLGPEDVLIDQGRSIQSAYATTIRRTYNVSEAITRMPLSKYYLRPTKPRSSHRAQDSRKITGWLSPLLNAFGFSRTGNADAGDGGSHYGFLGTEVEVYYTYVLDMNINNTGEPVHSDTLCVDNITGVKTTGTSWEYTVPFVGQELEIDEAGHKRIALGDDCLLYPTRRLLIWTDDWVIYDGPSFYWHGRVPVVPIALDKWPWEKIGYSLAMGNISMGDAVNEIIRGIVDTFKLKFDPPLLVNAKEVARPELEKLDLREPGARIMRSGMYPAQDVFTPVLDGGYDIPPQAPAITNMLLQLMDHQVGVADVSSLLDLQQAPSADATDRLLQAQGPLATDYARELEKALTEFGYLAAWIFLQFDTTQRRMRLLGVDGLTYTDFDFDPGTILPVHVPGTPKHASLMQRALVFGRQFMFLVVPNSIFEFTDTQDKLFKFQLWRDGRFPMDPWTLAEAWGLGNMGQAPGKNQMERYQAWQEMFSQTQAVILAKASVLADQIRMEGQLQMMQDPRMQLLAMMSQGQGMPGGGAPAPQGGGGGKEGRPPSGNEMPRLENKGSLANPRNPTISES